jgi:hypothetical protein
MRTGGWAITAKGDPLEMIARVVPFESFRSASRSPSWRCGPAVSIMAAIVAPVRDRNILDRYHFLLHPV